MPTPTPPQDPEVAVLRGVLAGQRAHVLAAVAGLSDADLVRPVLPSGWSCAGLVRHLPLDDESFWFAAVVAGDQEVVDAVAPDAPQAWEVPPGTGPQEVLAGYRAAAERTDEVLVGASADAHPRWWPEELFGDFRLGTVREVLLHVITETACHAGHLDAARELIDGEQWLVLDEGRPTP